MFTNKEERMAQDKLYAQVADEIGNNNIDKAVWAKAFSESGGNNEFAKSIYIKYRVKKILDEISDNNGGVVFKKNKQRMKTIRKFFIWSVSIIVLSMILLYSGLF